MPRVRTKQDLDVNQLLDDASTVIDTYSKVDRFSASSELTDLLRQILKIKSQIDYVLEFPMKEHLENNYLMETATELMRKYYPSESISASINREYEAMTKPRSRKKATSNVIVSLLSKNLDYLVQRYKLDRILSAYTKQEMNDLRDKFRKAMPWLYQSNQSTQT